MPPLSSRTPGSSFLEHIGRYEPAERIRMIEVRMAGLKVQLTRNQSRRYQSRLSHQQHSHHQSRHPSHGPSEIPDHWRKVRSISDYEHVKELDAGGLSKAVNVMRNRRTKELRVIKQVASSARPREELEILKRISKYCHLNYLVEYAWLPGKKEVNLVLEYCDVGDLHQELCRHIDQREPFPESFIWQLLEEIGKALAFLHDGIVDVSRSQQRRRDWDAIWHLDIKPDNIFLSSRDTSGPYPRLVLGDFGCATCLSDSKSHTRVLETSGYGTLEWLPPHSLPEVVGKDDQRFCWHTDIWQLGAVAASLCQLTKIPIRDHLFHDDPSPCGSRYSKTLNAVVLDCVLKDCLRRLSAVEVGRAAMNRSIGR